MHKLLARQLRRCFGSEEQVPEIARPLVVLIDHAYVDFDAERELHEQFMEQKLIADTLLGIGGKIVAELDLHRVTQTMIDEATKAVGAQFGAFFYDPNHGQGETYLLQVVSGTGKDHMTAVQLEADDALLGDTLGDSRVMRLEDVTADSRFSRGKLHEAWPRVAMKSLLAAPVIGRGGRVLGALLLGHENAGVFQDRDEQMLRGIAAFAAIGIDNARLHQAAQESGARLSHQAQHDSLTGLPNRTLFRDRVDRCIRRGQRRADYRFAVLFLDLDRFKNVNDSLGHAAGDRLLIAVAERLNRCLRRNDSLARSEVEAVVARMGGDEFTILLDDLRIADDANLVAERIVKLLGQPFDIGGQELQITTSIGIVHSGPEYVSPDELLRDADAAMYHAKSGGRARFATFDAHIHNNVVARLRLESDLRLALERDELRLLYQPIVCLQTREVVGFEALARWERDGRLISPAEFIPVAEDIGLIIPIGAALLREACEQLAAWRHRHPRLRDLFMSVNLSRRQLADPDLPRQIRKALDDAGLQPASLNIEITESMMMQDAEIGLRAMDELKTIGVGLQLDDFGTGYSSLSYLHTFPLTGLKIDRSFIADVAGRRDCVAVLQAITTLAHNLGIKVVAEGLERPDQVVLVQALECDDGQGYYFARPLAAEEAEQFALAPTPAVQSA